MASNGVPHRRQRCWTVIACCPKREVTSTSSVPLRTTSEATLAYPSSRPGAQSVMMLSRGTIIVSTQRSFVRGAGVGRAQVGVRRDHAVDLVEGLPARLAGEHLVDRHLRILNVAQRLPEPCLRVHRAAASLGGEFPWCRRKRRNSSWKMATISALLGRGHAIVPAPRPMWSAWRCPSACPGVEFARERRAASSSTRRTAFCGWRWRSGEAQGGHEGGHSLSGRRRLRTTLGVTFTPLIELVATPGDPSRKPPNACPHVSGP